jgi:hypothetical protein
MAVHDRAFHDAAASDRSSGQSAQSASAAFAASKERIRIMWPVASFQGTVAFQTTAEIASANS